MYKHTHTVLHQMLDIRIYMKSKKDMLYNLS